VPYMAYDLPAGGRRLVQEARGYVATIKSGEIVRADDEATEARPGRLVRGPQSPSSGDASGLSAATPPCAAEIDESLIGADR